MALVVLFLIGIVFGLGFKVRILIPATFLTVVLCVLIEIVHGQGFIWSSLTTTAAVIAIQMGYLIGMAARAGTRHGVTAVRKSAGRQRPSFYEWLNDFIRP